MNKREAKRRAHEHAYIRLQEWLDSDWADNVCHFDDAAKIEDAMNELAQRHFELAFPQRKGLDQ